MENLLLEFEKGLNELVWRYGGNRAISSAIEIYRKYLLLEDEFEDYKKQKEEEINSLKNEINSLKNELKNEINSLKNEINSLKNEINSLN